MCIYAAARRGPPWKAPLGAHVPVCTEPVLAHVYVPSPTGLPPAEQSRTTTPVSV
jgi:hypothetical protein